VGEFLAVPGGPARALALVTGLTPTYPIAGETDWILAVVELSEVVSHPGEHRSIPHLLNTLRVEVSQNLNTIGIHTTGHDPAIPEH
jgi:hypothetical protein